MRPLILAVAMAMTLTQVPLAKAQVSFGIGAQVPGMSLGISLPVHPDMVLVPGLPVYHAPRLPLNYFYFEGLFWVFLEDDWYTSPWYDGPWHPIGPYEVPDFILQVPVRYYLRPPVYFNGWGRDAPPRWTDRWGRDWHQRRSGWDRPAHRTMPPAAVLPDHQRSYRRGGTPYDEGRQPAIRHDHSRFQPNGPLGRHQYSPPADAHRHPAPAAMVRQVRPGVERKPMPIRQAAPAAHAAGGRAAAGQMRGDRSAPPVRHPDHRGRRHGTDR